MEGRFITKSYKPTGPVTLPAIPPVPEIVKKVYNFLKENDHMCQRIDGDKLSWCQKDDCEETKQWKEMKTENEKRKQFGRDLEKSGHTCVVYRTHHFPMDIAWCENDKCTGVTFYPHSNAESCFKK